MPTGSSYAGSAIDTSSRRSIRIRSDVCRDSCAAADNHELIVDYFYHAGEFWRALVPLNGIEAIYGQVFNFSQPRVREGENGRELILNKHGLPKRALPFLNHLQNRIVLERDNPVRLYPLACEDFGEPIHCIHDFIYSVETVGPAGVEFNLRDALFGNLLSAHRFLSTEEMVFERLVVQNQWITESPPLPLKEGEKRELLFRSLLRADCTG